MWINRGYAEYDTEAYVKRAQAKDKAEQKEAPKAKKGKRPP